MSGIQYLTDRDIPLRRLLTASDAIGIWCSCKTTFSSPQILIFPAEQQKRVIIRALWVYSSPQGSFLPPPLPVLIPPSVLNRFQPLKATRSFLCIFRHLPPPIHLENPEIKGFRGVPPFLFRGEEAGCVFEETFQGDFSGVSGVFRRGFPSCFDIVNIG